MIEFCEEKKINHEVSDKIFVASNVREIGFLDNLANLGNKNGLKGLKPLSNNEIKEREPNVEVKNSFLVAEVGIENYKHVIQVILIDIIVNKRADLFE